MVGRHDMILRFQIIKSYPISRFLIQQVTSNQLRDLKLKDPKSCRCGTVMLEFILLARIDVRQQPQINYIYGFACFAEAEGRQHGRLDIYIAAVKQVVAQLKLRSP